MADNREESSLIRDLPPPAQMVISPTSTIFDRSSPTRARSASDLPAREGHTAHLFEQRSIAELRPESSLINELPAPDVKTVSPPLTRFSLSLTEATFPTELQSGEDARNEPMPTPQNRVRMGNRVAHPAAHLAAHLAAPKAESQEANGRKPNNRKAKHWKVKYQQAKHQQANYQQANYHQAVQKANSWEANSRKLNNQKSKRQQANQNHLYVNHPQVIHQKLNVGDQAAQKANGAFSKMLRSSVP
ncbi:hypothetical protein LTR08_004858 [Meristemomyces frigidus]|nr:hypothetical protein LTR08_004858 [Meristemomyces frigidus]